MARTSSSATSWGARSTRLVHALARSSCGPPCAIFPRRACRYHRLGERTFDVVADRDAAAGSQLFEDYGDNDNTLYLSHHGFVAEDNPFDCVELRLPAVLPRCVSRLMRTCVRAYHTSHVRPARERLHRHGKLGRDKRKLLQAMRVDLRTMDTCARADRPISYPVHVYMAVAAMDTSAIEHCRAIIDGARDRNLLGACFGPAFVAQDALQDASVRAGLADAVQAHLDVSGCIIHPRRHVCSRQPPV